MQCFLKMYLHLIIILFSYFFYTNQSTISGVLFPTTPLTFFPKTPTVLVMLNSKTHQPRPSCSLSSFDIDNNVLFLEKLLNDGHLKHPMNTASLHPNWVHPHGHRCSCPALSPLSLKGTTIHQVPQTKIQVSLLIHLLFIPSSLSN
jgi:hypothetical protein